MEKDNSLSRDIQSIQASTLLLDISFWSGSSRKMEMAESFLQPWATMIRRSVSGTLSLISCLVLMDA